MEARVVCCLYCSVNFPWVLIDRAEADVSFRYAKEWNAMDIALIRNATGLSSRPASS
jgi:hypothetical protein